MRTRLGFVCSLFAFVGAVSAGPKPLTHLYFPGSPAELVAKRADVQKEIKLSLEQSRKIALITKESRSSEDPATFWHQVAAALTDAQRKRAIQLGYQALGPLSSLAAGLSSELKLQKEQLVKLEAAQQKFLLAADADLKASVNGEVVAAKLRDQRWDQRILDFRSEVEKILTPNQKDRIQKGSGPAFTFSPPLRRHGVGTWIRALGM